MFPCAPCGSRRACDDDDYVVAAVDLLYQLFLGESVVPGVCIRCHWMSSPTSVFATQR